MLGEYGVVFAQGIKRLREGARTFASTEQAAQLGLVALIHDVLDEIHLLAQRMAVYEQQLEHRVKNDATSRRLRDEFHGVGLLSASRLRVKVADARDFGNGRNFAAYLGLAPGHRGTGGKVKIGKLTRRHDRYLRQLLIHGARSMIYALGDKQDRQSCWLRDLVARRGVNIAAVALAHRNARQAWSILAQEQAV